MMGVFVAGGVSGKASPVAKASSQANGIFASQGY